MNSILVRIIAVVLVVNCSSGIVFAADNSSKEEIGTKASRMNSIASIMKQGRENAKAGNVKSKEDFNSGSMALKMIQGLGLVSGLFLIGAHFYKKYTLKDAPQVTKKIKIIERTPLGGKGALILAEVDGQKVLVGMGSDSLSLMKLEAPTVKLEEAVEEGSEDLWFALQKASASSQA
jgi:flagellar biogenesis protein FliO